MRGTGASVSGAAGWNQIDRFWRVSFHIIGAKIRSTSMFVHSLSEVHNSTRGYTLSSPTSAKREGNQREKVEQRNMP